MGFHFEPLSTRSLNKPVSRRCLMFSRVPRGLAAAVLLALAPATIAQQKPPAKKSSKKSKSHSSKKPAASQPADVYPEPPPPETESVEAALQRLNRIPAKKITREDAAWKAGLAFLAALSRGQSEAAADLVDAAGFHPLPWSGELPENPEKPLAGRALRERIDRANRQPWTKVTMNYLKLLPRREANQHSATIATWMLADSDLMLIYDPPTQNVASGFDRPACVIVRMRAKRAVIVAGTVLPGA